MVKKIHRDTT